MIVWFPAPGIIARQVMLFHLEKAFRMCAFPAAEEPYGNYQ